jgi:ankyrin repeat protein
VDSRISIQEELTCARFMLAQLHINSLTGKISPKAVRLALRKLPSGSEAYDEAYKDIMERIKAQCPESKSLAEQVIIWVTFPKWTLTTLELQHALAIEEGESKLDEENIPQIEDMVSVCAGLVTVDENWRAGNRFVRLVHYTAQEYFERNRTFWFPNADKDIATACITYLMFENLRIQLNNTAALDLQKRLHPLFPYAAQYWGDHARNAIQNSSKLEQLVMDFLENKDAIEGLAQAQRRILRRRERYYPRSDVLSTGLHMAAYFGLDKALDLLLQHANNPDPRDCFNNTPLILAAGNGHEGVVHLLLKTGRVDPDAKNDAGRTALGRAAQQGNLNIVKLLLETRKVDPNWRDEGGRTPLFYAAKDGNVEVVRLLLLSDKVDPNSEDIYGSTPLSIAARNGKEQTTKLLLMETDIQFSSMDKFGRTPIIRATSKGQSKIVKLLLEKSKTPVYPFVRMICQRRRLEPVPPKEL